MAKKKSKRRSKSRSNSIDQQNTAPVSNAPANGNNESTNLSSSPKLKSLSTSAASSVDEEDLSTQRHDEETVLSAIYGDDFTLETGAWGCPLYKLRIRPASDVADHGNATDDHDFDDAAHNPNANIDDRPKSCELTLHIQLNQKYPYSIPLIQITHASRISTSEISELLSLLQTKAKECAELGAVMGWEMGQVVESYLVDCVDRRRMEEKRRAEDMVKKKRVEFDMDDEDDDVYDYSGDLEGGSELNGAASSIMADEQPTNVSTMDSDTQREVARQIAALDSAAKMRRQRRQRARGILPSIADKDDENEEGDDDGEDDNLLQLLKGHELDLPHTLDIDLQQQQLQQQQQQGGIIISRYQTDFVEISHLGRGGGGEVVQAINRLDRRVYAIKKVLLEAETTIDEVTSSDHAKRRNKWASIQNEKLRREVTTISMMSHKNIVRYYQAWQERSSGSTEQDEEVKASEAIDEVQSEVEVDEEKSSSSWDSWSSSGSSTSDSSSEGKAGSKPVQQLTDYARSLSLDNFLEHEIETDFANPLLGGNGGSLVGYPPIATSSVKSSQPDDQQKLQPSESSYTTSDWNGRRGIMYIQMQYCKTTMRDMIDEEKLTLDAVWKSLRQILEALVYIHSQNVIHRDLKPANIFIDDEENIRLGDFGLACTSNRTVAKPEETEGNGPESEADALYDAIDDISGLLGASSSANASSNNPISMSSITGGVGTTFYMAPEQEHGKSMMRSKTSYDSKADIYSLGVLLFEMFMLKPLGRTYMERAEKLTVLRGEFRSTIADKGTHNEEAVGSLFTEKGEVAGDWELAADQRFPESFRSSVPLNAQKIILWCLERSPSCRPSAQQLLTCNLLPRMVELEERYLQDVLQTLSNPQSEESYKQILSKLFDRPTSTAVLNTYDSDVSIKANNVDTRQLLEKSLNAVKGSFWTAHSLSYSSPMSSVAMAGAVSALGRASHVGTSGGGKEGEALRGAPQQAATVVAMTAATSAAVEGCTAGILGADPRIVDCLCNQLRDIFQLHGAVRLSGPLLRPRDSNDGTMFNKPVELLARQGGSVLNLRENLCVNFARAVSRGGSATSNIKRFDINTCFLESDAGLYPIEKLEASFDIIQEENAQAELMEAESLLVLCQAMALLSPKETRVFEFPPNVIRSPIWYLRLTHTRLSDAILDLMLIPTNEDARNSCLSIFTSLTACPPTELCIQRRQSGKHKKKARELKAQRMELVDKCLQSANIPKRSAKRLRAFLSHFLSPHLDANKVLDIIYEATRKIHLADINSSKHDEVKRLSKNCFGEVVRCINELRQLLKAMDLLGIVTSTKLNKSGHSIDEKLSCPAYISIDLGLRHKRNHYSGQMFFQAILIDDDFFQVEGDAPGYKKGTLIATGGRYDQLVRQFRPPGNFGAVQVNDYTAAKVPFCTGLLIFVGKMVERVYCEASHDGKNMTGPSFLENLRQSLGHPMLDDSIPTKCIVTSETGLDSATCGARARIAALLWREGVSCEYLAQSGVMLSLLRHLWNDPNAIHEWSSSVDRVCGISSILGIPFVVVVQPHLLKKNLVKLRQLTTNAASGPVYNESEELIPMSSLPSLLLERLHSYGDARDEMQMSDLPHQSTIEPMNQQSAHLHSNIDVECIFVDSEQYFDDGDHHRINNAQWKHIKKLMKTSTQRMTGHITNFSDQTIPVVALDLAFQVVRDVGSSLIFEGIESLNLSLTTKYPQYKKVFRNLMYGLDALVRKNQSNPDGKKQLTLFLYSIPSDQYDLVNLTLS